MGNIMSFFFPPSRELPAPADAPLTKEEDTLAREVTEVEDTLAREVKEAEDTPAREVKVVEDTPAREVKEAEAPLAAEEEQLEAAAPVSAEDIVVEVPAAVPVESREMAQELVNVQEAEVALEDKDDFEVITEDVHHVPEAAGVETIGTIEDESVETVSAVPAATKPEMKQHVPEVLPEVQHIDLEELPVTKKEPEVQQHVEPKILPVPEAVPEVPQHTEPKAELDADAELGPTSQELGVSLETSEPIENILLESADEPTATSDVTIVNKEASTEAIVTEVAEPIEAAEIASKAENEDEESVEPIGAVEDDEATIESERLPEEASKVLEPSALVSEPATSVSEPATPVSELVPAVPVSVTAVSEPTTAVPEPATAVPEPATAVPEPATVVPEPVSAVPEPATAVPELAPVHQPAQSSPVDVIGTIEDDKVESPVKVEDHVDHLTNGEAVAAPSEPAEVKSAVEEISWSKEPSPPAALKTVVEDEVELIGSIDEENEE